jgi:hypothetical protein
VNVKNAMERAKALKPAAPGQRGQQAAAADLYGDIDYELALGDVGEEDYEQGENALAYLEEHFPGVRKQAHSRVENGRTPQLSNSAKNEVWKGADKPTAGGGTAVATRPRAVPAPVRQRVATRRSSYQASRTPRFAPTRRTISTIDQAATGGVGAVLWYGVLGAVGLSLLYLVLAGRGPQGVGKLFTGGSNVLNWIIDPTTDPLRPPTGAIK